MTTSSDEQKIDRRDVFISHRSNDDEFVSKLTTDIESNLYHGHNLSTWVDEAEIKYGQSITGMINHGLETSRFIVLVLTPAYFASASGWTDAEWHSALYQDPDNKSGRIAPLLVGNCEYIPMLIRHLKIIDMRGNRYECGLRELIDLLRIDSSPRARSHGGQLTSTSEYVDRKTEFAERPIIEGYPDEINEKLFCNLLPIDKLPKCLYVAPIADKIRRDRINGSLAIPNKQELIAMVRSVHKGTEHPFTPAFRVFKENIITFHDLQDPEGPMAPIVDVNDVTEIALEEFMNKEEERKVIISLLNMALHRHANRNGLLSDDNRKDRFFFSPSDGSPRVIHWKPLKKMSRRTVAKPCFKDGRLLFWRHHAVHLKILSLGNHLYIQIIPTWIITDDGFHVRGGSDIGRLLIKWIGAERNLNLVYHIRFWATVLGQGKSPIRIRTGDHSTDVSKVPAWVQQSYGIRDDRKDLLKLLDEEASVIGEQEDKIIDEKIDEGLDKLEEEMKEMEDLDTLSEEYSDEEHHE